MIRKFKFEDEIYESLNCLPMAARRKLDALGVKLSLARWEKLGRGERLMICHAPSASGGGARGAADVQRGSENCAHRLTANSAG